MTVMFVGVTPPAVKKITVVALNLPHVTWASAGTVGSLSVRRIRL